jgi:membrane protease YdiL (CAAX protease family)
VVATPSARPRLSLATGAGLFVALVVPLLTFAAGWRVFGAEQSQARVVAGLVIHWINFAALIAIVGFAERQPLASIGLKPIRWWTIPAGLVAGVAITILSGALVSAFRLSSDMQFATYLQSLPFILRLLLVVTAGVFEETLYRGYALERLAMIWGSKWVAAVVTVALFTLAHLPVVGVDQLLPIAIVTVFVTLLYLWRRDLILNMVAHATIDAIGLLVAPIAGHGALR